MRICQRNECKNDISLKDYRQKYCSHSCAAIVNNSRYPKRFSEKRYCLECKTQLVNSQQFYCSIAHQHQHKFKIRIEKWKAGLISGSDKNGELAAYLKNYLKQEAGYKCPECGWSKKNPISKKVTLTVDHINGDSTDNSYKNLRVLCYNCHTLTPTFNQLNRGNGKRYSPGQRMLKKENND